MRAWQEAVSLKGVGGLCLLIPANHAPGRRYLQTPSLLPKVAYTSTWPKGHLGVPLPAIARLSVVLDSVAIARPPF